MKLLVSRTPNFFGVMIVILLLELNGCTSEDSVWRIYDDIRAKNRVNIERIESSLGTAIKKVKISSMKERHVYDVPKDSVLLVVIIDTNSKVASSASIVRPYAPYAPVVSDAPVPTEN